MTEKKSNLPIVRKPISIQGSPLLRPIEYITAHGGFLSASAPSSPSIRALQTNVNSLRPKELPQLPFMTKNSSAEQGSNCQPHQRISAPRQPKPKLNVRVRETGPRSVGSYNSISSINSNINCDSPRVRAVPIKSSARRLSWSPAQAIPEGHYSKGFTLTTFRKTADKASSTSFPFNFSFTTSSSTPVSTSIKRPSTNHLERKETLTPFRRFVGRSKSMKLKTPGPIVTTESENALRTERFDSFYNNEKENSSPQSNKPLDMYNAKLKDRNSLGDPKNHTNGIQSQERLPFIGGWKVTSDSWKEATPAPNTAPPTPDVKPAITAVSKGPCKPLWQNTMTTAEEIRVLGLSSQEVQKQETIFELIYTESEYLDDLKSIHKIFVEELNVKMAESRRKKRFSPDKSDVKLYERLARLLSHIKDLWNGHQSLLRSLQNKQLQGKPVVVDIGSVFESELLKSPRCKNLTLEGIFIKPIQRLQKYPLFFKDLMNLTSKSDPDYFQLEHALNNHQRELTKIDDRIWIEEHNEMLMDLQQRIKGLPSVR
ncbi:Intersectin 1 (SH3 domain protein) [Entomortierella chlamydospora]|uniref:Intersectin 1 (SH3 domain protein) n=1 Tax=Entomortierella chlamydospora TaxID=101097 RepID=A0A9P6T2E8_9FUNG|nr:Intersectin 1 (SH3 domain protein) [Entomortierella chlamydospora]KAG0019682.1 Intersectin 1 (SH3 domain protein) [Entomortierella chlamydospora]